MRCSGGAGKTEFSKLKIIYANQQGTMTCFIKEVLIGIFSVCEIFIVMLPERETDFLELQLP